MQFTKVGIVGTGQMGLGMAQVFAQHGIETIAIKATGGDSAKKKAVVEKNLQKLVEREKITAAQMQETLAKLHISTNLQDLADCDLIIESVLEEIEIKQKLFRELDGFVKSSAIFASNTSTLCITEMAMVVNRKDKVYGVHFFNPATAMKLVEIIPTIHSDAQTTTALKNFIESMTKTPVLVKDETGFIVNRLLTPYMVDAIRTYERGLANIVEIDTAMKLGTNHPMGPFELADYIGLDIVQHMAENLYQSFREPHFAPPMLLKRLVLAGQLGRKTGSGFYDYSQKTPIARDLR